MRLKVLIALIAVAAPLRLCWSPATPLPEPHPEPIPELMPEPVAEDVPRPVAAGQALSNWQTRNSGPALAFDGQGHLNLFNKSSNQDNTFFYSQRQMQADGSWTNPQKITPDFQFAETPTLMLNATGQLCLLWSGEVYDATGKAVYGLFRDCQKADGTWPTSAEQPVVTTSPVFFSPSLAADGNLRTVYITQSGSTETLFYSTIDPAPKGELVGSQLSGDQPVWLARLAIDSLGGYHAAWVESTGGQGITVLTRYSKDEGATWDKAEQLYSGSATNPDTIAFQLLADPVGGVHLAWVGKDAILYRHWTSASGWDKLETLSSNGLNARVVLAVTKEGLAHAVWATYSNNSSNSSVTLRTQSADGSWGAPQTITPTLAKGVTLALDAQNANHIAWNDAKELRYRVMP